MGIEKHIGTVMRHTKKGVRAGNPEDRLYAVVGVDDGNSSTDGETRLVAWKMRKVTEDRVWHPALGEVSLDDPEIFCEKGTSDCTPTAVFLPDSHVQEVPFPKERKTS